MEKIKTETFETYAKDNGWMQVNEGPTPKGRSLTFLTPQGNFVLALYNLDGQTVEQLSGPPPLIMMQRPMPGSLPGLDLRGGGQIPR